MRWPKDKGLKYGVKRLRKEFLFFPKCIDREYRWWEQACWVEIYHEMRLYGIINSPWEPWQWIDVDDAMAGGYPWPIRQALQRMGGRNAFVIREEDYDSTSP